MNPVSVLYVEDEEDYQLLVRRILEKAGYEIRIAPTGEQGLSALAQQKPDLLILDVNLPDTDGYSLCSQVRQSPHWAKLPVLMLTVRRRPEEWLKGFSSGADDYVSKPLNPPELVARVRECVESRRKVTAKGANAEFLLIKAAVGGNHSAFEVLIQKYKDRLMDGLRARGENATDVEDIVAEALTFAYQQLHEFHGSASFYTWLYRIAINQSHRRRRRKPIGQSLEHLTRGDETHLAAALSSPDRAGEGLSQRVLRAQIHHAVSYIPSPYRKMLKWHFIRGLSYGTMARRLKIPEGTVMSRVFKAKQLFRQSWNVSTK